MDSRLLTSGMTRGSDFGNDKKAEQSLQLHKREILHWSLPSSEAKGFRMTEKEGLPRPLKRTRNDNMQKWLGLIGIFLLFFGLSNRAVWGEKNLIPNSSFENGSDGIGKLDGWEWRMTSAGTAGNCTGNWEKKGHSGKRAISIDEERWFSSSEWVGKIREIKSQTWYVLSLWTKRDRSTGWLPKIVLFGQERCVNIRKVGQWQRFDWILNSGDYSGRTELKIVVYRKPYKVWFDDLRLEKFNIKLLSPADREIVKKQSLIFSWDIPETKSLLNYSLQLSPDRNFLNEVKEIKGITEESYRLSSKLPPGRWFWRIKGYKNDTELAVSRVGEFTLASSYNSWVKRWQRKKGVWIGRDGFLKIRNRKFFPIGIYYPPKNAFKEIRNAGFNVIVGNSADIDAAGEAGLKVIARFNPKIKIENLSRNSALLAWYIWDEPGQSNTPPKEVWRRDKEIKAVDYFHPTAVVVYYPENYWTYASVSDIFMVDPYPVPHQPITLVSDSVETARKAVSDKKPIWVVVQAFDWKESSAEARRTGVARLPTYEEERCMAFLSIVSGAKGILFYRYNKGEAHNPEHWRGLKKLSRELAKISSIFLAPDGESEIAVITDELDGNGDSAIHNIVKEFRSHKYLIAVNVLDKPVTATFTQLPAGCKVKRILYGKKKVDVKKRGFTDLFPAYGVRIYAMPNQNTFPPGY